MVHSLRRLLPAAALCAVSLSGCKTWQPVTGLPDRIIVEQAPERVLVTRNDGVELLLLRPEVRAGAIVSTGSRGAVRVENVETIELRRTSVFRTVAFVLPAAIVLAVVGKASCRC